MYVLLDLTSNYISEQNTSQTDFNVTLKTLKNL